MGTIYIKKHGILVLFNVPRSVEFFCRYRCTSSTESQSLKALEALAPRRAGSHVRTEKLYVSWYIKAREIQVIKHHHATPRTKQLADFCEIHGTESCFRDVAAVSVLQDIFISFQQSSIEWQLEEATAILPESSKSVDPCSGSIDGCATIIR
eukprot:scaffold2330_cov59-Cylindrotheca_fusiformis.AAC.2